MKLHKTPALYPVETISGDEMVKVYLASSVDAEFANLRYNLMHADGRAANLEMTIKAVNDRCAELERALQEVQTLAAKVLGL